MLYLHVSNRTENLLSHLVELFRVSEHRDLFEKECFLIQSQGMERMISQTMAAHFKSWCNFAYFLPLGFLHHIADKLEMDVTPDGFERKVLAWRLEELLQDVEGSEYAPLIRYLQGENRELKRYQLANQLANIFDEYQLMRPEMLASWGANRAVTGEAHELWQISLWQRLMRSAGGGSHRGAMLEQLIERLRSGDELASLLPQRLSVIGLSIMPPIFLEFLKSLAIHSDIHLFLLSPCREYWGDIASRKKLLYESLQDVGGLLEGAEEVPESHPLLVSLGRQGRDFQRMLFANVDFEVEFTSYEDPLDSGSATLLRQLQSDLLKGEVAGRAEPWPDDDHSIRIVSCHSRMREITILKDHIRRWLYEDPELKLRDIVVMAPDIQEYAALIPAVFDDIQHSISDRSMRRRNSILAAFDDFLGLIKNDRFGWDELLELLKEPEIADKLQLGQGDLDTIHRWVTQSGIRWGLSAEHRGELGLPAYPESSWQAGIERLLMGYAIDSEELVAGVLPFTEIEGSGGAPLGALCQFVEVVAQARQEFTSRHSLKEWSKLLLKYAHELFVSDSERISRDFLELQGILAELSDNQGQFHQGDVDFAVIRAWLEHTAKETRSSSGFLRGQLTFCSMLPMRSIPFKVVCLIGLNDGVFPKNDRHATFDLMGAEHRPGDRSRRMDDRYQFLEALLAARDSLYLSYIGQSIKTNDEIPPSVVVSELLEVLEEYYQRKGLVTCHPLHPFSRKYFSGENSLLFSYDEKYCQVAEKLREPCFEQQHWWSGQWEVRLDDIPLADLFRFYRNPQSWFVRNCLRIRLDGDAEVVPESEVFSPAGLDAYLLEHELLEAILAGDDLEDLQRKHRLTGRWPLGVPGTLQYEQKRDELRAFAARLGIIDVGHRVDDLVVDLEVEGIRVHGRLANIYERGIVLSRYAKLKGKDVLAGWLHHLIYAECSGTPCDTYIFAKDETRRFSADCTLLPDLKTMVELFVEGCRRPSDLYIEPGVEWVKKAKKGEGMLVAAANSLKKTLEDGYDAELALLLRYCDPAQVLNSEFEGCCLNVLQPIWENCHVCR